jgi:hypothetical protein
LDYNNLIISKFGGNMARRKSKLKEMLELGQEYLHKQGYINNGEVIPSVAGLALYANCSRSSLYNYASSSEEFKDMLELIKTRQEVELINKGLKGEFNASIAKLMLANHGYSEKQILDHQSMGSGITTKSKPMHIELVAP